MGRPSDRNKVDLPFSPVPGEGSFPAWTTSSGISWCAAQREKPSRLLVVRQCQHTCQFVPGGRLFSLESLSSVVIRNDVSEALTRWKALQVYLECYGLVHYKRRSLFSFTMSVLRCWIKRTKKKPGTKSGEQNRGKHSRYCVFWCSQFSSLVIAASLFDSHFVFLWFFFLLPPLFFSLFPIPYLSLTRDQK